MVKELDFEAEKNRKKISNFVFLSYGHFPARNGSKSTIATKISEKVNKAQVAGLVDFF